MFDAFLGKIVSFLKELDEEGITLGQILVEILWWPETAAMDAIQTLFRGDGDDPNPLAILLAVLVTYVFAFTLAVLGLVTLYFVFFFTVDTLMQL